MSDVGRLTAKLDLRKDMMNEYKEKYERATFELF
jgi:hypothetical protein